MNEQQLLDSLNPEVIARFKRAIERGKWPDGNKLTIEQKETCMRAVIYFEHNQLPENQRTGYVPPKDTPCDSSKDAEETIRWK